MAASTTRKDPTRRMPLLRRMVLAGLIISSPPFARADLWSKLFPHDIDVITVTDMTEAGRAYPNATPANPVYYKIIDLGYTAFGRIWAGEQVPNRRDARKWMMAALAGQGYLLADALHPPTQLLVFYWGMMQGGPGRPALKFLGGDKADLMWEQAQSTGFISPRVLLRGMQRVGVVGKVWDVAESDLFLGMVRSYTIDSETAPTTTLLWETRFACPATGLWMRDALPLMIKAAALNLGRETKMPVNLNASDTFGGHVELGELKVMSTVPPATKQEHPTDAPTPPAEESR